MQYGLWEAPFDANNFGSFLKRTGLSLNLLFCSILLSANGRAFETSRLSNSALAKRFRKGRRLMEGCCSFGLLWWGGGKLGYPNSNDPSLRDNHHGDGRVFQMSWESNRARHRADYGGNGKARCTETIIFRRLWRCINLHGPAPPRIHGDAENRAHARVRRWCLLNSPSAPAARFHQHKKQSGCTVACE